MPAVRQNPRGLVTDQRAVQDLHIPEQADGAGRVLDAGGGLPAGLRIPQAVLEQHVPAVEQQCLEVEDLKARIVEEADVVPLEHADAFGRVRVGARAKVLVVDAASGVDDEVVVQGVDSPPPPARPRHARDRWAAGGCRRW